MKTASTKKALLMSVLSLLVCFTMLIGTTFAWFTDSVTSANNKIIAGNLKIDLEMYEEVDGTWSWKSIKTNSDPIFNYSLWEPGYVSAKLLKIENEGSLALKWKATFSANEKLGILADVIDVYVKEAVTEEEFKALERADIAGWKNAGTVREFVEGIETSTTGTLTAKGTDGAAETLCLALKMREEAGNTYQNESLAPFDITILATQLTSEKDSFDELYDANATYPGEAKSVNELLEALNNNMNVTLGGDIDLAGVDWTPIATYSGTFDGNGFAIENLKGENGLFETLNGATIKNLKLEDVDIDGTSLYTGAVAGQIAKEPTAPQTVIENVTVSGAVNGTNYYTGGLIGADSGFDTVVRNCVNNATVTASSQQVGGILGYAKRGTVIDSCVNNGDITGSIFVGGILGLAAGNDENPDLFVVVKNCKNTGDISETNVTDTWAGGVADIVGFVGREGGKTPSVMTTFYFIDNTVREGQKVYGRIGNVSGGTDYITVYAGDSISAGDAIAIQNAVAALGTDEDATFFLTDGNYDGDVNLTVAAIGADKFGDIAFVAVPGTKPVIAGTVTMGYHENRVGAQAFNAHITFEGITFDHAEGGAHSLVPQNLGSRTNDGTHALTLNKCTIIGDGEYGIGAVSGSVVYNSRITNCTFVNAAIQAHGNFGTGLVVEGCTFTESVINAQGGNGFTVKNCNFTNTLTDAHNKESFYVVRASSATPITVTDCTISVDSTVTGTGVAGSKGWGVFVNRNSKDIKVENVTITMTDAALAQPALKVAEKLSTGEIITNNVTVNGVVQ